MASLSRKLESGRGMRQRYLFPYWVAICWLCPSTKSHHSFQDHSLFFGFLEPHLFLLPRVAMPLLVLWVIELSPIFLYFFTSGNSPFVNKPSSGYPKKSMPSVFSWTCYMIQNLSQCSHIFLATLVGLSERMPFTWDLTNCNIPLFLVLPFIVFL